jgi:serine/threonine protein phosphatase PrpC
MSTSSDNADVAVSGEKPASKNRRPPSAQVRVDVGGLSDRGNVRPNNEDHFYIARFGRFLERLLTNLPEEDTPRWSEEIGYGMVVADGIGGSAGGEIASRLAISTFVDLALGTPDWILRTEDDSFFQEMQLRARERYAEINNVMQEHARADPRLHGFGTTMTLALSLGADLLIAHIGDSRAYLLRRQKLYQLTRDHTLAQSLADQGVLAQYEVATHRFRHVLTRALGPEGGRVEAQVEEGVLEDGDRLLLCSDGLTDMVDDSRIAEILSSSSTAQQACQGMVDEATKAGGRDNVTVVVARYEFPLESQ